MPTSPLLATLILAPYLRKPNEEIVLYADDGLIFNNSEHLLVPIFPPETGIILHPGKSGVVKEAHQWKRPLKFLGLTYHPEASSTDESISGGTLTTSTRIPKTFKLHELDTFRLAGYYMDYTGQINETYDHWLKQRIGGFLLSRLYIGDYHEEDLLQNFTLSYEPQSWMDLEMARRARSPEDSYRLSSDSATPDFTIFNTSSLANQSLSR